MAPDLTPESTQASEPRPVARQACPGTPLGDSTATRSAKGEYPGAECQPSVESPRSCSLVRDGRAMNRHLGEEV